MDILCRIKSAVLLLLIFPVSFVAVACSGSDDEPPLPSPSPSPTLTAEATSTPTTGNPEPAPSGEATAAPSPTNIPEPVRTGLPSVNVEAAFEDVSFNELTGLYQDAEGNWYATEQPGRIQRIDATSGETSVWLDITGVVDDSGTEMGLLGFALAPDFSTTGHFYVNYTSGGETVVARYTASGDRTAADAASEQRLLLVDQPFSNHNGGQILFGPDGYLYIGFGDGGGFDADNYAQDPAELLGSLLRIDVSGGGAEYTIPQDNPFVGRPDARGEVWAYGLRNPWRFSFDRVTGELWVADVGEVAREEVNLIVTGGNYGWNVMEGFACRGGGSACNTDGYLPPVFDYETRSGGTCSITGGFVYRGNVMPDLRGAYVFSDYCSGAIYALRAVDGVLTEQSQIGQTGMLVTTFAEDNDGELYAVGHNGTVLKLVP